MRMWGKGYVINVAITKYIYCIGIFMYILRCVGRYCGTCDMGNMLFFRRLLTTRQLHYPQVGFCWSSQQSPPIYLHAKLFEFDNTLFVIQSRKVYIHTKIWRKQSGLYVLDRGIMYTHTNHQVIGYVGWYNEQKQ